MSADQGAQSAGYTVPGEEMNRPQYEIADVIRQFGAQFTAEYQPNSYHQRVLNALSVCRTSELGGHKEVCDCCGKQRISYNSCRNRHCPKCQGSKQAFWVEDLLGTTLEVKHYHIVFTVPHELNTVCLPDSQWYYNCLFSVVWETLRQLGYTRFGVETGAVCVLHTWGQNLSLHPHIHCIVPAAGETLAGNLKHIGSSGKYLYPVRQLSPVFRGKLMERIESWLKKQSLYEQYKPLLKAARNKSWSVDCEPSLAKAEHVVRYLGQYTHRVAITNQRIISVDEKNVTFRHKDYRDGAKQKPVTLTGMEFLRRFCHHILPYRFVKIRRYGIYSSRTQAEKKKQDPRLKIKLREKESTQERIKRLMGFDVYQCPYCKQGTMLRVEELPRVRSPTSFYSLSIRSNQ
jgi:hypothetical protein